MFSIWIWQCRHFTWAQATIQVLGCDDTLSLHVFDQRNGSKSIKEEQKWIIKTKERCKNNQVWINKGLVKIWWKRSKKRVATKIIMHHIARMIWTFCQHREMKDVTRLIGAFLDLFWRVLDWFDCYKRKFLASF